MSGRRDARRELMSAAISLSLAHGFEATTVDEIAAAAGVARRTFFRHFRAKEDAVLPDHDACLARVRAFLDAASPLDAPLQLIGRAAELVLDMYAEDPETAVRRYEVIRQVPALREWEIAATSRYQRAFVTYLNASRPAADRDRFRLHHEVAASAVAATHNHVLRTWLRAGAPDDVRPRFAAAIAEVLTALTPWLESGSPAAPATPPDDIMIILAPRTTPLWKLAEHINAAPPQP
ncbi:TetR family transcriptional regulator [Actinocorallia sp. A-T 12471]|uniref:TetR family transcriptional regulator n=1 Tax=Actinocorallia sp. A-T 12471 TaxID=3089813 RepID=UPI0029CC1F51|nr:TetR family transcriptional regulator [Actinocorallia sp. A-T 12471]MDX6740764.1 TetR family transcriptional regulator [Actinocorallia sp. A-T 12471]